jgi:hypothetical protein
VFESLRELPQGQPLAEELTRLSGAPPGREASNLTFDE